MGKGEEALARQLAGVVPQLYRCAAGPERAGPPWRQQSQTLAPSSQPGC